MTFAWAHSLTDDQITGYLARIPGLGAVLYPSNYRLATEVQAIAYTPSVGAAQAAREYPFVGFIAGRDEPNVDGLSGKPLPASEARRQYDEIANVLNGHSGWIVPASLGAQGGFLRTLFFRQRFDHEYHRERGVTDGTAWAPTRSQLREVHRVLRAYGGHHVLSPALYRSNVWNRAWQPSTAAWMRLASDRVHIAVWSLESWRTQPQFGLFDRDGTMTNVGTAVRGALAA